MKKILAITLILVVISLLSACGDNETQVGDVITLGGYDWQVLDIQDGKALILSEKILEERAYNSEIKEVTWEECSIRQYLNDSFYNGSFSDEEKKLIAETKLVNNDNPQYGTKGGNETYDKVFLLSIDEVNEYVRDNSDMYTENKRAAATSHWWLRSPGPTFGNESNPENKTCASYVTDDGRINILAYVVSTDLGVRPALWLNLK